MRPPVLAERVSMEHSDEPEQASEAVAPVNDIFDAVELASAVNFEEFKHFLDPISQSDRLRCHAHACG